MRTELRILDIIALTQDISELGLLKGQVGTIVEKLDDDVYEIEFSDNDGRAYAIHALNANQLLILHYEPLAKVA